MKKLAIVCAAALVMAMGMVVRADDGAHEKKAAAIADKAIAWLKSHQGEKGGWSVPKEGPAYPAITALVINGMLMQPGVDAKDPAVAKAVGFILSYRQSDGGIYDKMLPSYNTSIVLSALAKVDTPEAKAAIKPAQDFLRSLQFGEGALTEGPFKGETGRVGKNDPAYGGVGYGRHGRPDLSNTAFFLQAMHDSGVSGDDPAFQRALEFLKRTQMIEKAPDGTVINPMPYAKGSRQGGFIYAVSENKDKIGSGQSMAGEIEETMDDGQKVSRLRAYGSMTYAGFKSLIYAQLPANDPRVVAAYDWIRRNYTLSENPGMGTDGMYYYFVTFARGLTASAALAAGPTSERVIVTLKDGKPEERNWANDLIDRLGELQNEDGSFKSVDDRWMENNPELITAYALIALQHARGLK
jgi:squalene-hopene/tetraprenyl-beta-curcumene cyclase